MEGKDGEEAYALQHVGLQLYVQIFAIQKPVLRHSLISHYILGTTCISHSAPYWPFRFPRFSASPKGPDGLVTLLANRPSFSPVCRNSRNRTDVSIYSRNATRDSSVVPVTSFIIHGTINGASVHEGWAVPARSSISDLT